MNGLTYNKQQQYLHKYTNKQTHTDTQIQINIIKIAMT